jgi:hypothetical protein
LAELLDDSLETAQFDGNTWSNPKHDEGASAGRFIKWHTIADQPSSVVDVRRIRQDPLVTSKIPIYGFPLFSFSFLRTETAARPHQLDQARLPGSLPSDSRELKQDSPHNNNSTRYQNELV